MKYLIILFSWMMLCSLTEPSPGKGLWTVTVDPSGRYAVTGGDDRVIRLYQTKDMKLLKTFPIRSMIRRLAWQPFGQLLAVATNDKHMHLRNMVTGDSIPLQSAEFGGRGITWSYNGKFLAVTDNHLIKIFSKKGQLIRVISKENQTSYFDIDWHPSQNLLLVSGDDIRLYEMSGKKIATLKHREEQTGVLSVEWHPSGNFFVSGDYGHDGEGIPSLLQYWTLEGKLFKTIKGSKMEYRDLQWNQDGSLLSTASDKLRIWTKDGEMKYEGGDGKENLWGVSWNEYSKELVTVDFTGILEKWNSKAVSLQRFE